MNLAKTKDFAKNIRLHALKMTSRAGTSHIGSMFSIADIIAVLYNDILIFNSKKKIIKRDRFILSKGHAGGIVYAALAEKGFFPKKKLDNYCRNGSFFSGHISHHRIPGVELSTGSLGHGLSVACGMAMALKNMKKVRVFNLMSDGELNEGSNWEAIMFASHFKLNNLINIIDYNKLQSILTVEKTLGLEPLRKKWISFGWKVLEIDGHNYKEIYSALKKNNSSKPLCVIAHTTKGKGVDFMENNNLWHYRTATGDEFKNALKQIIK
jgi:transketolase